jgi:hypothetical protein
MNGEEVVQRHLSAPANFLVSRFLIMAQLATFLLIERR